MSEQRRTLLINRPFQIRFSIFVCSWLIPLSLMYPIIIYKFFDIFINYIAIDSSAQTRAAVESTRQQMFWLLLFLQLIFIFITFVISIFVSHRIAGPLYKLGQFFDAVSRGNLNQDLHFRKKDYFVDLAEEFNLMLKEIRSRLQKHQDGTQKAIAELETALMQVDDDQKNRIQQIIQELKEIQGPKLT